MILIFLCVLFLGYLVVGSYLKTARTIGLGIGILTTLFIMYVIIPLFQD